jgi:hypothetical protein
MSRNIIFLLLFYRGPGSSVGIANRLRAGQSWNLRSMSGRSKKVLSSSQGADRLWGGVPEPLSTRYWE